MNDLFATQGFVHGEGKTIQPLQLFGDAATLQQHRLPRYLRGMGCEYGSNHDPPKSPQRRLRGNPSLLHAQHRAVKRSGQGSGLPVQLAGAASPFAMVGLCQICQLEINRECFCDLIRAVQIHFCNHRLGAGHQFPVSRGGGTVRHSLAMPNRQAPQLFDSVI